MLRNSLNSLTNVFDTVMRIPSIVSVPVRYRYFKDKPTLFRRYGFDDKMAWRGPLPRLDTDHRIPKPMYTPAYNWTAKKALFGQNDYIDILGDQSIHPSMISYNVPPWLRGFYGNEFQVLLRQKAFFGAQLKANSEVGYGQLIKNMKYQFKFLNRRTPQNRMPVEHKRYHRGK